MSNDDTIDWFKLDAYFAGVCTPEERAEVDAWVNVDPRREQLLGDMQVMWEARKTRVSHDFGRARAIERVMSSVRQASANRANGNAVERPTLGTRRVPMRRWVSASRMVAVAAVVLVCVMTWRYGRVPAPAPRVYDTATGQRSTLSFSDGTKVTLAPRSRLVVSAEYGRRARTVDLIGEAYFDVRQATRAPFVVRTGGIVTRVLGTTFNVRRYASDVEAHVAVTTGKVGVTTSRGFATLHAGQMAIASDSLAPAASSADVKRSIDWVNGRLVFDDMPVPSVLTALSRWYGYEFRLADSTLVHERLTTEFRTDAARDMLEGLQDVLNVTLTFQGDVVTLHARRSRSRVPTKRDGRDVLSHSTRELGR